MVEYHKVSIRDDLWERAERIYRSGRFGHESVTAVITYALRRYCDEVEFLLKEAGVGGEAGSGVTQQRESGISKPERACSLRGTTSPTGGDRASDTDTHTTDREEDGQ